MYVLYTYAKEKKSKLNHKEKQYLQRCDLLFI